MKIHLTISGRGYDAAAKLPPTLELADSAKLSDALDQIAALLPVERPLATSCLVIVAGQHVGTLGQHDDRPLRDGDELLLLAPVAGG